MLDKEIFNELMKEAENGDISSQYYLGHYYYGEYTLSRTGNPAGWGLIKNNDNNFKADYEKSAFWWSKSAEQGDSYAQKMLGICYINGKGVSKDCVKGVDLLVKAARHVNHATQILTEAAEQNAKWLIEAAEQGSLDAKELFEISVKKLIQAAEQGDADEQYRLGNYYLGDEFFYNSDSTKDYEKAVYWYTRAAEQGHGDAHCALGYIYKSGEFIPQDYEKAIYWLTKAVALGDDVELVDYDDPSHLLEEIEK